MSYGRVVVALGMVALLLGPVAGPPAVEAQQVVKIGVEGPITGPLAKMGQELANAVKLAAEDWNKKEAAFSGRRSRSSSWTTRTTRRRACPRRRRPSPIPPCWAW